MEARNEGREEAEEAEVAGMAGTAEEIGGREVVSTAVEEAGRGEEGAGQEVGVEVAEEGGVPRIEARAEAEAGPGPALKNVRSLQCD